MSVIAEAFGATWLPIRDADPRGLALYRRHYSAAPRRNWSLSRAFAGNGEKLVLLTPDCRALFVWRFQMVTDTIPPQHGVNCAVFRNEGPRLSSDLICEAATLAWQRWPGERLYTFVNAAKVRSSNPGYCFLMAGWARCGVSKGGLLILELLP